MRPCVLDFDVHFALGVFADGDAVHAEIAADDRHAGDLLDGQEQRVDRAVAGRPSVSVTSSSPRAERQRHRGRLARAGGDLVARPSTRSRARRANLLLDQGGDVAVVDFLLLVGQLLELVEDRLQLLAA